MAIGEQDAGSHQTPNPPVPCSQTSQHPELEKQTSVVYKPPSLWQFVNAAQMD